MKNSIPNIYSYLNSNTSVLIIGKSCDTQGAYFSGINFAHNKDVFLIENVNELTKFKSYHFSHIFIHGFTLRDFNINLLSQNNITYQEFCIDLMGEGFDIDGLLKSKHQELSANKTKVKILIPFNHYNNLEDLYPDYHFFKYELGGPRIFCSRFNRLMIHRYDDLNQVCAGLSWSNSKKEKLFMCLNNEPRLHRVKMVKSLINNDLLNCGYVTFKSDKNTFEFYDLNAKRAKIYNLPQIKIDESLFSDNLFGLHPKLSSNSYIDVVTESRYDFLPFKTEKCVKPFYNLQFPIILGHQGIVNDLRKMDFDMFDDIIDHSYDLVEQETNRGVEGNDLQLKTSIICKELIKLSKLDIHSIYLKNKERFLYNQENLFKKTITDNYIHRDLGNFIFGNNIKVYEANKDLIEKIYI